MPLDYEIKKDENLVILRLIGMVKEEELFDHVEILKKDPKFRKGMNELIDLQGVQKILATTNEITKLADTNIDLDFKQIALIAPPGFPYGMARMFKSFSNELAIPVEIFNDYTGARKWLGLKN